MHNPTSPRSLEPRIRSLFEGLLSPSRVWYRTSPIRAVFHSWLESVVSMESPHLQIVLHLVSGARLRTGSIARSSGESSHDTMLFSFFCILGPIKSDCQVGLQSKVCRPPKGCFRCSHFRCPVPSHRALKHWARSGFFHDASAACLTPPSWCMVEGAVLVNPGGDRSGMVLVLVSVMVSQG